MEVSECGARVLRAPRAAPSPAALRTLRLFPVLVMAVAARVRDNFCGLEDAILISGFRRFVGKHSSLAKFLDKPAPVGILNRGPPPVRTGARNGQQRGGLPGQARCFQPRPNRRRRP